MQWVIKHDNMFWDGMNWVEEEDDAMFWNNKDIAEDDLVLVQQDFPDAKIVEATPE